MNEDEVLGTGGMPAVDLGDVRGCKCTNIGNTAA